VEERMKDDTVREATEAQAENDRRHQLALTRHRAL
jgi:hypothetical protein